MSEASTAISAAILEATRLIPRVCESRGEARGGLLVIAKLVEQVPIQPGHQEEIAKFFREWAPDVRFPNEKTREVLTRLNGSAHASERSELPQLSEANSNGA